MKSAFNRLFSRLNSAKERIGDLKVNKVTPAETGPKQRTTRKTKQQTKTEHSSAVGQYQKF